MYNTSDTTPTPPPTIHQTDPWVAYSVTDIAIIAGMIAAIAFILVGLIIILLHYLCHHKGTYYTNEDKGTGFAENTDAALQDDSDLQDASDSSSKEYFI